MLRTLICYEEMAGEKMGYAQMEAGLKEESSRRNRGQHIQSSVKAAKWARGIQAERRGSPVELKRI